MTPVRPTLQVKPSVSACRLCKVPAELINSHIVPDFYIRSLERRVVTGSKGQTQPTSILLSTRQEVDTGQKQRGHWEKVLGLKQPLLCRKCEEQFAVYERWFREFFYGTNPSPLKKVPVGTAIVTGETPDVPDFRGAREVLVEYAPYKLFVLSLLWRASVANGTFFSAINLGDSHETRLSEVLLSQDPGPEAAYAITTLDLRFRGDGFEDVIEEPFVTHEGGYRLCNLVMGGFLFSIHVASAEHSPPEEVSEFMLRSTGRLILLSREDSSRLRPWIRRLNEIGGFPS